LEVVICETGLPTTPGHSVQGVGGVCHTRVIVGGPPGDEAYQMMCWRLYAEAPAAMRKAVTCD
jgi:hypothetical protein